MVVLVCCFIFLTGLMWGICAGVKKSRKPHSVRTPVPKETVLLMTFLITLSAALVILFAAPGGLFSAVYYLTTLFFGLIAGFFVGRTAYFIT